MQYMLQFSRWGIWSVFIAYRLYRAMQTDDRACRLKTELLSSGTFRVLVGVTGSVAALKLPLLVSELLKLPGVSCYGCLHFNSHVSLVPSHICVCACDAHPQVGSANHSRKMEQSHLEGFLSTPLKAEELKFDLRLLQENKLLRMLTLIHIFCCLHWMEAINIFAQNPCNCNQMWGIRPELL